MSDLVLQDNELKQVRLATFHESQLGKHDIMKLSLTSAVKKIIDTTAVTFREACSLMFGAARLYDRKVDYILSDAADLFDGLSNPIHHQRVPPAAPPPSTIAAATARAQPPVMVATTPRRPRQLRLERIEKPSLDVEAIAEVAREEELSEGFEFRGPEGERPSISLPESVAKPARAETISIEKASVPGKEREEREEFLTTAKRRSYIADVKDAIKKSMQKARERSKRKPEELSAEKIRAESAKKRSSLAGAATVGLFTPLQLSTKERVTTPAQGAGWEQEMDNIISEIKRKSSEKPGVAEAEELKVPPLEVEEAVPEVAIPEEAKAPSYTIMTKKVRQKKVATKEQENAFQEMIQSGRAAKEDYTLGLPGDLGKFINDTLKETIGEKHPLDVEAEERREELIRRGEAGIPPLPEFIQLETPERIPEEYKELDISLRRKERLIEERPTVGRESVDLSASLQMDVEDIGFQPEQPEQVLSQMDLKMIQYINERLKTLKEKDQKQIGFMAMVEGESKENKIKALQELLSLEAKDMITMEQDTPFGEIIIIQKS